MKKMIGIILICVGVIICMIPIALQLRTKYEQKKEIEQFKKLVEENEAKNAINDMDSPENTSEDQIATTSSPLGEDLGDATQDLTDLELEQADENTEEVKDPEEVRKSLNEGQTLVALIEIPKIDIVFTVVEGTARYNLRAAIGHMKKTAMPGKEGNCVLAGHRGGIYGAFFKDIHKLEIGDEIIITDVEGNKWTYEMEDSFVVEPDDMSVIKQPKGEKALTLISCENNGKDRIIVTGKLMTDED